MKEITTLDGLLRAIDRGNDIPNLKVIKNKKGKTAFYESRGCVTVKLPDRRTYTMSRATYEKLEPYLV